MVYFYLHLILLLSSFFLFFNIFSTTGNGLLVLTLILLFFSYMSIFGHSKKTKLLFPWIFHTIIISFLIYSELNPLGNMYIFYYSCYSILVYSMVFCFNRFESYEILNDPNYFDRLLNFGNIRFQPRNDVNVEINVDFNVGNQNVRLQVGRTLQ